ncbi:MAG: ABC-F type ribosomal protection protein [Clostridiaceae bacterium]|nr:ABC-F type ribosomal protection protein [Clostridiaceae bacterium]
MSEIVLQDIHKYYGANHVLKGVSLEIYENSVVGLVGKNGSGKTTLFKIITGEETYDKGDLMIARGRRIGVLDQIPDYDPETTVYEVLQSAFEDLFEMKAKLREMEEEMAKNSDTALMNKYGAMLTEFENRGGFLIQTSINKVCNGLNIDEDMQKQKFSLLSGGEKTRVNLGRIILMDCHILLLDEPTNHLDISSVEWLEEYLQSFDGTVIVISHDRYFLDRVANKIIELEDGVAFSYEGNYSKFALLKEQRRIEQLKHYEQEQRKIKQLEQAVKRMHDWANRADNPKLHKRAFGMEKRLERLRKNAVPKPKKERKLSQTFRSQNFSSSEVVFLKNICKSFGDKNILNNVNLLIKNNDRIALLGDNGSGKTTLLKIINGELKADVGVVRIGPSVKAAYLPQMVFFERPELTILEIVQRSLMLNEERARNLLAGFNFTGDDVYKTAESLSGGEKSRLKLCFLMQNDVNLLILDEPTNHLDIASREWMEEVLDEFEGTILFVSHDRYFIRKFARIVCELEDGKLYYFNGDYEEYRQWRQYEIQQKQQADNQEPTREKRTDNRKKKQSPKALEKRLSKIEDEISETENKLIEIENDMEIHSADYEKLSQLLVDKQELELRHEELLKDWVKIQNTLEEYTSN